LDAIVVNLTDAGQEAELGSGSLYIIIQWKLSKNQRKGGVIDGEAELLTTA